MPELYALFSSPKKQRAQGKPDAQSAPAASYAKVKSIRDSHHRFAGVPGLPCATVLTVSFALSLVSRAFLPPSPVRCARIVTELISASGYQDHATSPSAFVALVLRHCRVHRIPPNVRDDGQRPSCKGGTARRTASDLPVGLSEIFFAKGLDTGISVDPPWKNGFFAQCLFRDITASIRNTGAVWTTAQCL